MTKIKSSASKPLVVVTRPKGGVCPLTQILRAQQIEVLQFPVFKRVRLAKRSKIHSTLGQLHEFAAILFTSAHSVDIFFDTLKWEKKELNSKSISLIAIGSATAARIKNLGYPETLSPAQANSESMIEFLEKLALPPGSKILYPKVSITRGLIEESLKQQGMNLVSLPLYKLEPNRDDALLQKCVHEMQTRPLLIFTFFSSSAFTQFMKMMAEVKDVLPLLKRAVFAALGPVTQKTIESKGYGVPIVPDEASAVSLAKAIQKFLAEKPSVSMKF